MLQHELLALTIRAKKRGCPLVAVQTPDPEGTVAWLRAGLTEEWPLMWRWDCVQGSQAMSQPATQAQWEVAPRSMPEELVLRAFQLPPRGTVIALWQPEFWGDPATRQALMALRDEAKANRRLVVLVGRGLRVPVDLEQDFLVWEESLPGPVELAEVLRQVETAGQATVADMPLLDEATGQQAIGALQGMSLFQAEQQAFLALNGQGLEVPKLWQAKIALINHTPGLACWQGGEGFGQVQGLGGIKGYLQRVIGGKLPVRLVMWVDEIEKALAGAEGDLSGISQDFLGTLLTHLQDTRAQACLLFGHPGLGKSLIAKATGQEAGCLTVRFDPGACKGSLVGESEQRLRQVLAMERAIVGHELGTTLWLVTCNSAKGLPQELRSRFQAEWFYDYPGSEAMEALWYYYMDCYDLSPRSLDYVPEGGMAGWSGREIERCCRLAWQLGLTLQEASQYIVPASVAGREQIEGRRKEAQGRYLDAETGRVYQVPGQGQRLRAVEGL